MTTPIKSGQRTQKPTMFNNFKSIFLFSCLSVLLLASCGDDDGDELALPTTSDFTLNISGLEDLGEDYAYEGWIIVDGVPQSAGIFNVDTNGALTERTFDIATNDLSRATAYVLTIEPSPDTDPAPSKVHILGGNFSSNSANLIVDHPMALGTNFLDAKGSYLLGTPTDGALNTNERSGIWWEDLSTGTPLSSLELPTLPEGWEYEGWVVVDGQPLTTGKFLEVDKPDFAAPFSGTSAGPPFPGEDFIINAPSGLSFPLDLSGRVTAISVEPSPDNSPHPFLLKPLFHTIPQNTEIHTGYEMNNNASNTNPTGSVIKNITP